MGATCSRDKRGWICDMFATQGVRLGDQPALPMAGAARGSWGSMSPGMTMQCENPSLLRATQSAACRLRWRPHQEGCGCVRRRTLQTLPHAALPGPFVLRLQGLAQRSTCTSQGCGAWALGQACAAGIGAPRSRDVGAQTWCVKTPHAVVLRLAAT